MTDLFGQKVTNDNRQASIATRLKAVMSEQEDELRDRMPNGIIAHPDVAALPAARTAKA